MSEELPTLVPSSRLGPSPSAPPDGFRVEVAREHEWIVVAPVGELDIATVDHLDEHLRALHTEGARQLVLDLTQLTFIDSTGLRLVVNWNRQAEAGQLDLSIIEGPPAVQRTFELSGLGVLLGDRTHIHEQQTGASER